MAWSGAARSSAAGLILALGLALVWTRPGGAASAAPPYAALTRPLAIEQVPGEPIYYTLGNPGVPDQANEGNTSNAGFIVTSDGVVVFDALGTPSLAGICSRRSAR